MTNFYKLLIIVLISNTGLAQDSPIFCEQIQALKTVTINEHYLQKPINDSLSKHVLNLFINKLDDNKDYFIEEDIALFKSDTYLIDNYINGNQCEFSIKYANKLELRYNQTKTYLETLRTAKIDYSGTVKMVPVNKNAYNYYDSLEMLQLVLTKRVGFNTLFDLVSNNPDISHTDSDFKEKENTARQLVIDREICKIEEFLNRTNGVIDFVNNQFLNAYLNYFDPNSTYFNTNEKDAYQNSLATNEKSFGLETTKNKKNELTVAQVTPGGSAFKNGNINEEDVILELKSSGDSLLTNCLSNEELFAFLNEKSHLKTTFVVRDKNNTIKEVTLTKSEIKVSENAVKGFVIGDSLKIGYLKIPSFYTNYDSPNGRGLTVDIAKELYKLQRENVEGLIIDLQFNGGGSMQEAIELSGLFIDKGPISILKFKDKTTYTIRDPKRGVFFKDPIVVLVNQYSASASELFAAAIQDYKRGIIVGSTTYGKGTAQNIMPLKENKNLGFAKVTVETFFRITGKSHQEIGILPDIKLPSIYQKFEDNEASKPFVVKNDTVQTKLKYFPLQLKDLKSVSEKSKNRISKDTNFIAINSSSDLLYNYAFNKRKPYTLTPKNVKDITDKRIENFDAIFSQNKKTLIPVSNTKSTLEIISYNEEEQIENEQTLSQLSKDIYINEAYNIITDYINKN